jgi:hypothetical protein
MRTIKTMERLREERASMPSTQANAFSVKWGLATHRPFFPDIFYPTYRTPFEQFHLIASNCTMQRCDNLCGFFCVFLFFVFEPAHVVRLSPIVETLTEDALEELNKLAKTFCVPPDCRKLVKLEITTSKGDGLNLVINDNSDLFIMLHTRTGVLKQTLLTKQQIPKWLHILPLLLPFWLKDVHLKGTDTKKGILYDDLNHHEV